MSKLLVLGGAGLAAFYLFNKARQESDAERALRMQMEQNEAINNSIPGAAGMSTEDKARAAAALVATGACLYYAGGNPLCGVAGPIASEVAIEGGKWVWKGTKAGGKWVWENKGIVADVTFPVITAPIKAGEQVIETGGDIATGVASGAGKIVGGAISKLTPW